MATRELQPCVRALGYDLWLRWRRSGSPTSICFALAIGSASARMSSTPLRMWIRAAAASTRRAAPKILFERRSTATYIWRETRRGCRGQLSLNT